MSISVGEHAYGIDIPPNGVVTNVLDISDGWLYFHGCGYALIRWHLNEHRSNVASLTIGLRDWGERPCPAKASCDASLALFLHRHEEQLDNTDIGFLVLNGSNTAVTVAQPLFNDSRLIVHAPKIGYSNEVFAVDATATNATVAARGTTEWRVPWTNLWSRLPAADRTSLTNAHEVDLYWRSGEFTSEALPLWIE